MRPCSFAIVIQQLPAELRDPVCIFYLVLRALDTVEDDMAIEPSEKLPVLHSFSQKIYDRQVPHSCSQLTSDHRVVPPDYDVPNALDLQAVQVSVWVWRLHQIDESVPTRNRCLLAS